MDTKNAVNWGIALLIGAGVITVGFRFAGWLLTAFFILNCLVLIIVVLLQSGKAADLAGAFGGAGSQTAFGPRGAANVLSKATTWCAIMFMLCAMAMVLRTDKAVGQGSSILERVSQPAPKPAPATTPVAPPTTSPMTPSTSQPSSQPPSQPPATAPSTSPSSTPPSNTPPATKPPTPSTSQPNPQPASQPPVASQPAPAPTKKP
jgi:preprotein translocase subunit SecG